MVITNLYIQESSPFKTTATGHVLVSRMDKIKYVINYTCRAPFPTVGIDSVGCPPDFSPVEIVSITD